MQRHPGFDDDGKRRDGRDLASNNWRWAIGNDIEAPVDFNL